MCMITKDLLFNLFVIAKLLRADAGWAFFDDAHGRGGGMRRRGDADGAG